MERKVKKITTVELMEDGNSIGHAPVIEYYGEDKSVMMCDGDKPITFNSAKEAKKYGSQITEEVDDKEYAVEWDTLERVPIPPKDREIHISGKSRKKK